jgi:predicted DNA repair protein MutK
MAGTSLLALIDDIATVLDDVGVMTKVAAKKTAGVLGDDLALNAEQVTGIAAERELPVIWGVAKGGLLNKVILVPAALVISTFISWAITPLLMVGGGFLSYEGFHKVLHAISPHDDHEEEAEKEALHEAVENPEIDMVEFEKKKIKGAIRTDFILSAEIIVIALGTVPEDATLLTTLGVLTAIAVGMVVVVYGLVAGIVKIDDIGVHLVQNSPDDTFKDKLGHWILAAAPKLMRFLGIAGTVAMFLVGGGILAHGIGPVHHLVVEAEHATGSFGWLVATLLNGLFGIIAGGIIFAFVSGFSKIYGTLRGEEAPEAH